MTVPERRHTKESITKTLQNLARQLGRDCLSTRDVQAVLPMSSLRYHFGQLSVALEAAGLRCGAAHSFSSSPVLSDDELFASLLLLENTLGCEPAYSIYQAKGTYSTRPFKRFGSKWDTVLQYYRKWKAESGATGDREVTVRSTAVSQDRDSEGCLHTITVSPGLSVGSLKPDLLYGEPIHFRGLQHAPINEQGVVYLFGMVSRELGFIVESVQQGFPDCEAKYLHDKKNGLWARARIEFEFRSANFREHGHDPRMCDFVVCWRHDWPECPVAVIELQSEIQKLPSR